MWKLAVSFGLLAQNVGAVVDKEVFYAKQPKVYENPRTLVLSHTDIEKSHSRFLQTLRRNHKLTIYPLSKKTIHLFEYDERSYENVILIPGTSGFPNSFQSPPDYESTQDMLKNQVHQDFRYKLLNRLSLLEFIDRGGNVFFMGHDKLDADVKQFARECGIDFGKNAEIIDHFNTLDREAESDERDEGDEKDEKDKTKTKKIFGSPRLEQPIIPKDIQVLLPAISHTVSPSQLTFNIVSGGATAYVPETSKDTSIQTKDIVMWDGPTLSGQDIHLVSAMQGRNSARAVFMGSSDPCSDAYFELHADNQVFCDNLAAWNFMHKNVLRMSNMRSHKVGEEHIGQPYMYRIGDEIVFKMDIEEYSEGQWQPYVAPDVQLEFVMLDPYIRAFLDPPQGDSSTFTKVFKSPDVYGVFKFRINHSRVGFNHLHLEELAPLRNFKHNDYERFIWCASPYYLTCLMVPFCLMLVSIKFLYHKEEKGTRPIPLSLF